MFIFGEKVKGYKVEVLNEREVRAGAGILFAFALFSFSKAWFAGDFSLMRIFVTSFFLDFTIRLFINPKYSPSLILGRIGVSKQRVEYAGAKQKRFAWGLGWVLSVIMFVRLVVLQAVGPFNLFVCLFCLILLFFESALGICVGCYVYNYFAKDEYQLCPGGLCEMKRKEPIQHVSMTAYIILITFVIFAIFLLRFNFLDTINTALISNDDKECMAPEWAIEVGHEEMWKTHNGCE